MKYNKPENPVRLVLTLAFLCGIPKVIAAFEPSDYPQTTIKENRATQWNSRDKSVSDDSVTLMDAAGVPFSTSAIYLLEKRRIDTSQSFFWSALEKSRKMEFKKYYHQEIKVKDQDGITYWIPIQDTHLKSFEDEVGNCGVILYLIWYACSKDENFQLLNEFAALDCSKSKAKVKGPKI